MSPKKRTRARNTPGPTIGELLTRTPASTVATSNEASSADMESTATGVNAEILQEIRSMNQDIQQKIQKVGDDVTAIKDNLDSLKSDVAKLGSRTSEAETRISHLEDDNTRLLNLTHSMDGKITQLEARVEYQENYSRRNNLRIKGVPEGTEKGQNMTHCMKDMLQCLFIDASEDVADMIIERAHRTPTALNVNPQDRRATGPRHILMRFLRFADREKVRHFSGRVLRWTFSRTSPRTFRTGEANSWR